MHTTVRISKQEYRLLRYIRRLNKPNLARITGIIKAALICQTRPPSRDIFYRVD
jgi:hypothetical protein